MSAPSPYTVRVAPDPQGEEKHISISNGVLSKETLMYEFPGATGLKYCLDGVWTTVNINDDAISLPIKFNDHLFVVVNNVHNIAGPQCEKEFESCKSEITSILRQTPPRHLAVTIGNTDFISKDDALPGSKTDLDVMTMMLSSPPFNYTVLKCSNLTSNQMRMVIKAAVGLCTEDLESFLCFVSTHGYISHEGHQLLKGVDNKYVNLSTDLMTPTKSTSAPKVFLVNACRSRGTIDQVDKGVEVQVSDQPTVHGGEERGAGDNEGVMSGLQEDRTPNRSRTDHSTAVPKETNMDSWLVHCPPNFLLVYACRAWQGILDFVPFSGNISWLVHSLKEVMKRKNETKEPVDLLHLITEANGYCCQELEVLDKKYTFVLEHRLTSEEGLCFSFS